MPSQFLAIGECMVELSPAAETGTYALGFAGDTFNTAWYARRLAGPDLDIGYLTAAGDDPMSAKLAEFIAASGITPRITTRPGETAGLYLISVKDGERSFSYWRSAAAARHLAEDLTALEALGPGDMAYASGITVAILLGDGREKLISALQAARARGVTVAFDPNLRPRLWASTEEMCHWVMAAAGAADIALPSYEDEADYFGDADTAATAARYEQAGARLVVVKDGAGPVLARAGGADVVHTPTPAATVFDTTAAGDSFNAGFLVRHLEGAPLPAALAEGSALAARVIGGRGALVDL